MFRMSKKRKEHSAEQERERERSNDKAKKKNSLNSHRGSVEYDRICEIKTITFIVLKHAGKGIGTVTGTGTGTSTQGMHKYMNIASRWLRFSYMFYVNLRHVVG